MHGNLLFYSILVELLFSAIVRRVRRVPLNDICVIVPVYNVEKYIKRCVDSILSQTYETFTLVLVDDGSPDNCGSICDEYAAKDGRIVVIHQENGGLSAARNAGLDWMFSNSDCKWVTFIDSDDWVDARYLEVLINSNRINGTDISVGGFVRCTDQITRSEDTIPEGAVCKPEILWKEDRVNATVAWGKLYKRELYNTIRYPERKIHEDEYTTYKVLFKCNAISYINCPLYFYYQNESGIMGTGWSPKWLDEVWALKEQVLYFDDHNLREALEVSLSEYIDTATYSICKLNDYHKLKKKQNMIRRDLRLILMKYRKYQAVISRKKPYFYRAAYPKTSYVMKKVKKICSRVFRAIKL